MPLGSPARGNVTERRKMEVHIDQLPIDVSSEALNAFCQKWRVRELALFGSVVREDFCPESDIDVLATFDDGAPWSLWELGEMTEELKDIFGRKVDLVEKDALRNPFRRQAILNEHRVIYAA